MSATTSEADTLARVLHEPELDQPRLDFASLVGGARAEAITHGIRARDARRQRLDSTALRYESKVTLATRAHPEWSADVKALVDAVHFGRGFVEGVTLSLDTWLAHKTRLVELAPILHLRVERLHGRASALASDPLLAQVRSLDLAECQLDDEDVRALVASPHLARLRWISLERNAITEAGVAALAEATARALPYLRYAGLALTPAGDPCDEPIYDEPGRVEWHPRSEGTRLEKQFGELPWLHAHYVDADRQIFYVT